MVFTLIIHLNPDITTDARRNVHRTKKEEIKPQMLCEASVERSETNTECTEEKKNQKKTEENRLRRFQ